MTEPLQLRILSGPLQTAHTPLEPDHPVTIGYGLENMVVLRDQDARGLGMTLHLEGAAAIGTLQAGSVMLLGQSIEAVAEFILPLYVPVTIGGLAFAIGTPGDPRWADAERLVDLARQDAGERSAPQGAAREGAWHRRAILSPILERARRLPHAPMLVALGATILLVGALMIRPAIHPATSLAQVRTLLNMPPFRELKVRETPSGMMVEGYVPARADRERLAQLLDGNDVTAAIDVVSGEELATSVSDVFHANGIEAVAEPLGHALVRVRVPDPNEAARVRQIALRDVSGIRNIELVSNVAPNNVIAPLKLPSSVILVAAGPNGYIKTANGNRYFTGALLDNNYSIDRIEGGSISASRNGGSEPVRFRLFDAK